MLHGVNDDVNFKAGARDGGILPDGRELVKMVLTGVRVYPGETRAECFSGWRSAWVKRVPK